MADKKAETKTVAKAAEPATAPEEMDAEPEIDETQPGGHYIVDGVHRDAHGNELTKAGKPKAKPEE